MAIDRELTTLEQTCEVFNRINGTSNVLATGRIQGRIKEDLLQKAVLLTQQRHPFLSSRIVSTGESLRFDSQGVQPISLRVIENCQEQSWQKLATEELNQEIESRKSLARVVLLRSDDQSTTNYLFTIVHHAIADGLSSLQLQSQILVFYHEIESEQLVNPVATLPEVPPLNELVPKSMIKSVEESKLLNQLEPLETINNFETLGFEKMVPCELRRCAIITQQLDKELTQGLLNSCRQEKTTVHGALCAAVILSAAKKISAGKKKNVQVSCLSAFSLRKFIQPEISDEHIACIASPVVSYHKIEANQLFWNLAREVRQKIESSIDRGDIFSIMSTTDMDSMTANLDQAMVTAVVTNLGKVKIPKNYGSLELEEIHFVPAASGLADQLLCAVTTFEGRMFLNFPFSQPSLSQETMEIIVHDILSYLNDAIQGKNIIFDF